MFVIFIVLHWWKYNFYIFSIIFVKNLMIRTRHNALCTLPRLHKVCNGCFKIEWAALWWYCNTFLFPGALISLSFCRYYGNDAPPLDFFFFPHFFKLPRVRVCMYGLLFSNMGLVFLSEPCLKMAYVAQWSVTFEGFGRRRVVL